MKTQIFVAAIAFCVTACATNETTSAGRRDGRVSTGDPCKPIEDWTRSDFCDLPGVNASCPPRRTTCDSKAEGEFDARGEHDMNRIIHGRPLP